MLKMSFWNWFAALAVAVAVAVAEALAVAMAVAPFTTSQFGSVGLPVALAEQPIQLNYHNTFLAPWHL